MCLIIHKPEGERVLPSIIQSAMDYNPDGIGIMSQERGAEKYFGLSAQEAAKKINRLGNCAVHFRMATHGEVSYQNIHPYKLTNGGHLMHNGILSAYAKFTDKHGKTSDTQEFVNRFVNRMLDDNSGQLDLPQFEQEIAGNAIAVMCPTSGDIRRFGSGWNTYKGCEYSNQYAWDKPGASKWRGTVWDNYVDDYDYENVVPIGRGATSRWEGVEQDVGKALIDDLYSVIDLMDLSNYSLVTSADEHLLDDVARGAINVFELLEELSYESLLWLYRSACEHRLV